MPRVPPVMTVRGRSTGLVKQSAGQRGASTSCPSGRPAGACWPSAATRAARNRYAAMPAAPCIHPTPGGSSGSALRCSTNRHQACGPSRKARSTSVSARRRANARSSGSPYRWNASRKTSPTPTVPQQRPSLSQKPGSQALGQPGGADAVQAAPLPGRRGLARHLVDARQGQGGEEAGGARRAVAPAVGELLGVGVRRPRHLHRHPEAVVTGVAERDQVLGAAAGGIDEVRSVELGPGERQHVRDAGQAVRPVGHLVRRGGAEAQRHEPPVEARRLLLRLGEEHVGRVAGELARTGHGVPRGPGGTEQHARGAERGVVDPAARQVGRRLEEVARPSLVVGQLGQPRDGRGAVRAEGDQDPDVAGQAVEVVRHRAGR